MIRRRVRPAGVKAVTGDLSKVETVKPFKGVDGVFLVKMVRSPTEVYEGLLAACALREEKVKRVVYLSVHHADGARGLCTRAEARCRTGPPQSGVTHRLFSPEQLLSE